VKEESKLDERELLGAALFGVRKRRKREDLTIPRYECIERLYLSLLESKNGIVIGSSGKGEEVYTDTTWDSDLFTDRLTGRKTLYRLEVFKRKEPEIVKGELEPSLIHMDSFSRMYAPRPAEELLSICLKGEDIVATDLRDPVVIPPGKYAKFSGFYGYVSGGVVDIIDRWRRYEVIHGRLVGDAWLIVYNPTPEERRLGVRAFRDC